MAFIIRKEWFGGLIGDTQAYNLRVVNNFTYNQLSTTRDISSVPEMASALAECGFPTNTNSYKIFDNTNEAVRKKKILSAPIISWLEILSTCNLSCLHCFSEKRNNKAITTSEILNNIKNLAESGVFKITLTGGEAISHKDINKIIYCIENYEIGLRVFSNGCLEKSFYDNIKNRKIDTLFISIDGAKDANDFLRGNNTFSKAVENIEYISNKLTNVKEIVLSYTITKENMKDLDEIYKMCKDNGIHTILMRPLMLSGKATEQLRSLRFNKGDLYNALNQLNYYSDKYNIEYQINKIPFIHLKKDIYKHDSRKNIHLDSFLNIDSIECVGGKSVCGIKSDGTIIPCGFIDLNYQNNNLLFNDHYKAKNWEKSHNLSLMRNIPPNSTCKKCPALFLCNGGCRANSAITNNSKLNEIDDFCIFQDTRLGKSLVSIEELEPKLTIHREELRKSRERFLSNDFYISDYNIVSKCGWAGGNF